MGITPRIIIHGGAGNITRDNLTPQAWREYRTSLLDILHSTQALLFPSSDLSPSEKPKTPVTALEAATHAVTLLENNPLFNSGKGAVFTSAGTIELEASVMVSSLHTHRKHGCSVMLIRHVKNPIQLAAEMLRRGDDRDGAGGGAGGHVQLAGPEVERLAHEWGLDLVEQSYFWTRKRWDEHKRGLARGENPAFGEKNPAFIEDEGVGWDGHEYLPQGTVGCVVLDSYGTICVATSTGGLTNKLPGRIGDTPTMGAGFWAEEWMERVKKEDVLSQVTDTATQILSSPLQFLGTCFPRAQDYLALSSEEATKKKHIHHAVGMSGTGNGDSFLRLSAVRTAAAMCRFSASPQTRLATAVLRVAGSGGELQQSAGNRWGKTGEGEGGIIGIECIGGKGSVVWDFNCGGMFRAWIDDTGKARCMVFKEDF